MFSGVDSRTSLRAAASADRSLNEGSRYKYHSRLEVGGSLHSSPDEEDQCIAVMTLIVLQIFLILGLSQWY